MAVVRWEFYDPDNNNTYVMHINPRDGGSPNMEKTVAYTSTSAPDGKAIIYEGQDKPLTLEWEGVILVQAHYNALENWYRKRRQIRLTDHLGRVFWIYIQSFKPTHRRSNQYPWKHDYTMSAMVLDWTVDSS